MTRAGATEAGGRHGRTPGSRLGILTDDLHCRHNGGSFGTLEPLVSPMIGVQFDHGLMLCEQRGLANEAMVEDNGQWVRASNLQTAVSAPYVTGNTDLGKSLTMHDVQARWSGSVNAKVRRCSAFNGPEIADVDHFPETQFRLGHCQIPEAQGLRDDALPVVQARQVSSREDYTGLQPSDGPFFHRSLTQPRDRAGTIEWSLKRSASGRRGSSGQPYPDFPFGVEERPVVDEAVVRVGLAKRGETAVDRIEIVAAVFSENFAGCIPGAPPEAKPRVTILNAGENCAVSANGGLPEFGNATSENRDCFRHLGLSHLARDRPRGVHTICPV